MTVAKCAGHVEGHLVRVTLSGWCGRCRRACVPHRGWWRAWHQDHDRDGLRDVQTCRLIVVLGHRWWMYTVRNRHGRLGHVGRHWWLMGHGSRGRGRQPWEGCHRVRCGGVGGWQPGCVVGSLGCLGIGWNLLMCFPFLKVAFKHSRLPESS